MNQIQKQQIITQIEEHYRNDEIVKGKYWEDGKGCAIGCISHSGLSPHEKVSEILDIPLWMAHLIDDIFEGLPNEEAKEFPLRFVKAIPENVDPEKLELIRHKIALYQLNYICKDTDHITVKDAIEKIKELHQKVIDGQRVSTEEWSAARAAALSAAISTAGAAAEAAWSAADAAAESVAVSAADAAAESAESVAVSAAEAAYCAALSAAYKKIADKLIEYVKEAEN